MDLYPTVIAQFFGITLAVHWSCVSKGLQGLTAILRAKCITIAPVAADVELQRRLAGCHAEQRVPELVVPKCTVFIGVRIACTTADAPKIIISIIVVVDVIVIAEETTLLL